MDPMRAPALVIRNLEKFLDCKSKKMSRLVCNHWKEVIDEEGELSIIVSPEEEGNWEFVSRIRNPYSLCFASKEFPENTLDNKDLCESNALRLHIMCESDYGFLQRQIFSESRSILTDLVFSGNFFWKSELQFPEGTKVVDRCNLPCLKTLNFFADTHPSKISREMNVDYNNWGPTFRQRAQKNIHYILNIIHSPNLKSFLSESISCFVDNNMRNIKSVTTFFAECAPSLKTLKMSNQRSDVERNYNEDTAIPNVEELVLLLFDIEVGLDLKVFDTEAYWGKFLRFQSKLRKIRLEYLALVPKQFVYDIISKNEKTLEEFVFSCAEHNTRMVIIEEENIIVFDCAVFAGCENLKILSLSVDWEMINIDMLPNSIETLIFQGCLITNETLTQLKLSKVKIIEISRNIFSTGQVFTYDINEETVKFLTHIRSLDSLFVEKLKDDIATGSDSLEEFFEHFSPVSAEIPDEKFFPDHYVSLKL